MCHQPSWKQVLIDAAYLYTCLQQEMRHKKEHMTNVKHKTIVSKCLSVCRSPVGVGVSLMSWGAMVESGMRGKGFKIVHLYGDHLW